MIHDTEYKKRSNSVIITKKSVPPFKIYFKFGMIPNTVKYNVKSEETFFYKTL